jgi:hypothetical protein
MLDDVLNTTSDMNAVNNMVNRNRTKGMDCYELI